MPSASCSAKRSSKSPPRKSVRPKFHFAAAFDRLPWPDYFVFCSGIGMRAILLAVVVIQIGLAIQIGLIPRARAEDAITPARPISDMLPLFSKNHCESVKDPADVLFCGAPE